MTEGYGHEVIARYAFKGPQIELERTLPLEVDETSDHRGAIRDQISRPRTDPDASRVLSTLDRASVHRPAVRLSVEIGSS